MQPAETLACFMCNGFVSFKNKDPTKFQKHLNNEHAAYFGMEYLLAGCIMTEEERMAVKDVVKDRVEHNGKSDQKTIAETVTKTDAATRASTALAGSL